MPGSSCTITETDIEVEQSELSKDYDPEKKAICMIWTERQTGLRSHSDILLPLRV